MIAMTVCASHAPGMERDATGAQGTRFRRGLADVRAAVTAFAPDLVVLFAGDHRRAFAQIIPAFAVVVAGRVSVEGSRAAHPLDVPEHLATSLVEALVTDDFDVAVCRNVVLDHGFRQPLEHLLGGVAAVPVVPVAVNCVSPPLPHGRRVLDLGTRVGEFFAPLDSRVLFVGTGGLSHDPPTLSGTRHDLAEEERRRLRDAGFERASQRIRPEWDNAFLGAIERWDVGELVRMTDTAGADAGVGANEVRTWLAATAAGGSAGVRRVVYEPVAEWITGMAVAVSARVAS
jgi:2,3-dihydroxyphenylpropionate 1,2-dioxygenase